MLKLSWSHGYWASRIKQGVSLTAHCAVLCVCISLHWSDPSQMRRGIERRVQKFKCNTIFCFCCVYVSAAGSEGNKDKGSYKFASRLCKNCKKIGWQLMDDNWLTVKNILQVDKLQKGHGLGLCKLILFANEGKFKNISPRDTRILLRNVFHNCTWHLLLNHSTRQKF